MTRTPRSPIASLLPRALLLLLLLVGAGLLPGPVVANEGVLSELPPAQRKPVALVPLGERLVVCNQAAGSLSIVDPRRGKVTAEISIAPRLAHAAAHPGPADLLVLDDERHRLLAVTLSDSDAATRELAKLPPFPVRLAVDERSRRVFVTSLWSRRVTIVEFDELFERVERARQVPLPFPPRELLWLNEPQRLLVADAFAGGVALLDPSEQSPPLIRRLPAHNIRGLAITPDGGSVYISHQSLDSGAWTDRDSVHWGILMANTLRAVRISALLDPGQDVLEGSWLEQHGLVGSGAGDPGAVWSDSRGRLAVALAGMSQVAVTGSAFALKLPVGRRPVALAELENRLFVANQLDDTLTEINLRTGAVERTIALGPPRKLSAPQRGERLFFDARLSHDGWMSCHSCHSEGHTTGLLADTKGDGSYGAPKRIPSLLGTAETGPWAWNGDAESLEQQIRQSVRTTMHGPPLKDTQVHDLAAYLRSLTPPPRRSDVDSHLAEQGRRLFQKQGCVDCHRPPRYTSAAVYDVGLADQLGERQFNPPSLRGVGQRDRFFHDGRATRLEDVVRTVRHQLPDDLSDEDAAALLEFLKSL